MYDYDDQLVSTGGSGFAYDAARRRASRTSGGVTTSFLYDGGAVLLEKQGGTTTATYTYGNALIRKDGETPLFDGLGSERTVTNSSQSVTASLTLSAFGQTIASSGSSTSAYQFGATNSEDSAFAADCDDPLLPIAEATSFLPRKVTGSARRQADQQISLLN